MSEKPTNKKREREIMPCVNEIKNPPIKRKNCLIGGFLRNIIYFRLMRTRAQSSSQSQRGITHTFLKETAFP